MAAASSGAVSHRSDARRYDSPIEKLYSYPPSISRRARQGSISASANGRYSNRHRHSQPFKYVCFGTLDIHLDEGGHAKSRNQRVDRDRLDIERAIPPNTRQSRLAAASLAPRGVHRG